MKLHLSFEFFPPSTDKGRRNLVSLVNRLLPESEFISITQTSKDMSLTAKTVEMLDNSPKLVPHMTCYFGDKQFIQRTVSQYRKEGTRWIMCLLGDMRPGVQLGPDYYASSVELIKGIGGLNAMCACYPEPHPLSKSQFQSMEWLKEKEMAGARMAVSQMCFDSFRMWKFIKDAYACGVEMPIVPGIMAPVKTFDRINAMCKSNGIYNPEFKSYDHMKQVTRHLIKSYKDLGVTRMHFFTMNSAEAIDFIMECVNA